MAPMTAEHKQKMAEGRARSRAARAAQGPQSEVQEWLAAQPQAELLGTIKQSITDGPVVEGSTWVSPSGEVVHLSEAPPWITHVVGKGRDATDARQFVQVPDNWVLRWRSPKSLDMVGQLGWMPVTVATPGVKPIVRSMVSPEGLIRRGYQGDILHFMPRQWWENRVAEKQAAAARLSGKAAQQSQQFIDDANSGRYGRHIRGGWDSQDRGKFPVATGFDAKSGEHPT